MSGTDSTDLQATAPSELQAVKDTAYSIQTIEESTINETTKLPSLEGAAISPMPMSETYWSPVNIGDSIQGWSFGVGMHGIPDVITGEIKVTECMFFLRQVAPNQLERVISAGKQLVGSIKTCIENGLIVPNTTLTPIIITYTGERPNKKNTALKSKIYTIRALKAKIIED